jgi:hypothetical protein
MGRLSFLIVNIVAIELPHPNPALGSYQSLSRFR